MNGVALWLHEAWRQVNRRETVSRLAAWTRTTARNRPRLQDQPLFGDTLARLTAALEHTEEKAVTDPALRTRPTTRPASAHPVRKRPGRRQQEASRRPPPPPLPIQERSEGRIPGSAIATKHPSPRELEPRLLGDHLKRLALLLPQWSTRRESPSFFNRPIAVRKPISTSDHPDAVTTWERRLAARTAHALRRYGGRTVPVVEWNGPESAFHLRTPLDGPGAPRDLLRRGLHAHLTGEKATASGAETTRAASPSRMPPMEEPGEATIPPRHTPSANEAQGESCAVGSGDSPSTWTIPPEPWDEALGEMVAQGAETGSSAPEIPDGGSHEEGFTGTTPSATGKERPAASGRFPFRSSPAAGPGKPLNVSPAGVTPAPETTDLAARIKHILDEEARRHGIEV